jgi:predicted component of type VI protein secretion system
MPRKQVPNVQYHSVSANVVQFSTEEVFTMAKLLVIAVDVNSGTINEPNPTDPKLRAVGMDSDVFDDFIAKLDESKKERPKKANHITGEHPYFDSAPPRPKHVATILQTHHSPGCAWVVINGWPFCIKS